MNRSHDAIWRSYGRLILLTSPDKMARYHARKKELSFVFELLKVAHLDG